LARSLLFALGMKAVIISAVPEGHSSLTAIAQSLVSELGRAGYDTIQRFEVTTLKLGYCQGEFDCWVRTPGQCKIHDAEQEITAAIPGADALVLLGPVAFGGFSHALKRAIDRLICLISPFFERRNALTHHEPRYAQYPKLHALGWLPRPDAGQAAIFDALNDAMAINLFAPARSSAVLDDEHVEAHQATIRRMLETHCEPGATLDDRVALHRELLEAARPGVQRIRPAPKTAALLVGSAKPKGTSASECVARAFERRLEALGVACRLHHATEFVHGGIPALAAARSIAQADLFLLATPLYVDSLPSLVTHALELVAHARGLGGDLAAFVPFINCGFPEAEQTRTAVRIAREFAAVAGYDFAGALPLGGGGVLTPERALELDEERPPVGHVVRALALTVPALALGKPVPDAALQAIIEPPLPDALYRLIADLGFRWQARRQGTAQRELRARPFAPVR
jgi:multimeric flavodoxin WrbA